MEKLSVVGWTSFDSDYPTRKINQKEFSYVVNLIQKDIAKNCYMFSGEEHQTSLTGVPVFSDGTCFRASMRCWASIMASTFKVSNNERLSYMDFYMSLNNKSIMPKNKEIKVKPKQIEDISLGYYIKEDLQIITETLSFGLEFVTTDKVLKKLYNEMVIDD